jgi:hypothetical protein
VMYDALVYPRPYPSLAFPGPRASDSPAVSVDDLIGGSAHEQARSMSVLLTLPVETARAAG